MRIDWTTFALEIVNFLVLVWILKRFLYRPVLDILARRQAGIAQVLAQAHASEERAAALQADCAQRLADWEDEKARARAALDAELAAQRALALQSLSRSLADERERQAAVDAHQRQLFENEKETQAMAQARQFCVALLRRLACPAVEAQLLARLLDEWVELPEARLLALRRALAAHDAAVTVSSAFALSAQQQQLVRSALAARLLPQISVRFVEDSQLLAGLRVSLGAWHMHLNFADELASFAAASDHAD